MDKLSFKVLTSLRVGDVVKIQLPKLSSKPNDPFVVAITSVTPAAEFGLDGKQNGPVVSWEPSSDKDYFELSNGKKIPNTNCSSHYITEIIERAPYVIEYGKAKNSLVAFNRSRKYLEYRKKFGKTVATDPVSLACLILSQYPELDIPYGLCEVKLFSEWHNAGRPGFKGYYDINSETVSLTKRGFDDDDFVFTKFTQLIHVPQFKTWVLKRWNSTIRTKAMFRRDMIAIAEMERDRYEDYIDEMYSSKAA